MLFPDYRPRRLRQSEALRRMIRETSLSVNDLILPLFAIGGQDIRNPIPSMPGHFQLSVDNLLKTAKEAYDLGIPAIVLFGVPDKKDSLGTRPTLRTVLFKKPPEPSKINFRNWLLSLMFACASTRITGIAESSKATPSTMTPAWT